MANLRDQFAPYYPPGPSVISAALRTGLVTPDSNVLLAPYRLEPQARDELLSALEKLGERLWIPHQVGLEFHRNRLGVIAAQEAFFGRTRGDLEAAMSSYLTRLRSFTSRIAMPQARARELEQPIRDAHAQVQDQVTSAEEANEVHLSHRDSDDVLTRLEALFDGGRVGEPMPPDAFEAALKEAKRRLERRIPPGYSDREKADPFGDYLAWRQLLDEAAVRRVSVVLVTDDQKGDWMRREHGLAIGPRPELYEEMSAATGASFLLMSTATFLRHAEEYLSVTVSPETVEQARELPDAQDELRPPTLGERSAQAKADFERIYQLSVQAENEAQVERAHEASLSRDLANQTPPNSLRTEAELEASRSRQAKAEERVATLKLELGRLSGLIEALDSERREAQRAPTSIVDDNLRERLAELHARTDSRGDAGSS
jgi:hypothetical protein